MYRNPKRSFGDSAVRFCVVGDIGFRAVGDTVMRGVPFLTINRHVDPKRFQPTQGPECLNAIT